MKIECSSNLYIGIMSGTSLDGVDAVLTQVENNQTTVLNSASCDFPHTLQQELLALCNPGDNEIERLGKAESELATVYAQAVQQVIQKAQIQTNEIAAIGCHGQTLRHHPELGFSLQANNPSALAAYTNIPVIADFRRKDIALKGQGAPLVPQFHLRQFSSRHKNTAVLNLGGIANVTILNNQTLTIGFDTGPANLLLDYWCHKNTGQPYDKGGQWAATGKVINSLLESFLQEPYFQASAPKSTGRELFNPAWLEQHPITNENPADVQRTLLELTTRSVSESLAHYAIDQLIVCGGGAYNDLIMQSLNEHNPFITVASSATYGIAPELVEGAAFAWLAWAFLHQQAGNVSQATGASRGAVLGGLYLPN